MSYEFGQLDGLYTRALRQYHYGDYAGGVETLRKALSMAPDHAEGHGYLAIGLIHLKRLAAARHEAGLCLRLDPDSAYGHYVLGLVLHAQRKYRPAIEALEHALSMNPDEEAYHLAIARARGMLGDHAAAKASLERALEIAPEDADVLAELGDWYRHKGDRKNAEMYYREALTIEPENQDALVGMGYLELARGNVEEAREHAVWALQQHAGDTDALFLLAGIKARSNPLTGLWWKLNTWLSGGGAVRAVAVLIGVYALYRLASLLLIDAGHSQMAGYVSYLWLGIVLYSWACPAWFNQSLEKELKTVRLRRDF